MLCRVSKRLKTKNTNIRLLTTVLKDIVYAVQHLLQKDQRIICVTIETSPNIGFVAVNKILHENLGVRKSVSLWV